MFVLLIATGAIQMLLRMYYLIYLRVGESYGKLFFNSFLIIDKAVINNIFHDGIQAYYRKCNLINKIFYFFLLSELLILLFLNSI